MALLHGFLGYIIKYNGCYIHTLPRDAHPVYHLNGVFLSSHGVYSFDDRNNSIFGEIHYRDVNWYQK